MRASSVVTLVLAVAAAVSGSAAGAPGSAAAVTGSAAAAPRVQVMVFGRARLLAAPRFVRAAATSVAVARRRCAVAAATPLAALAAVARARGPGFRLHDYGACARRAADSGALFVTQIGPDRNHRADGWVYKVNRVVPGAGAADPSGRRLRAGDRLTWFYCRAQPSGGCQRTLEVTPLSAPGEPLRVRVRGYDNEGRGAAVAGAMVTAGDRSALTAADGTAAFPALAAPAVERVLAERSGMVPAFPAVVRAG